MLVGGTNYDFDSWRFLVKDFDLDEDISKHLVKKYGCRASEVAKIAVTNPDLKSKIDPKYPYIKAEVVYTVRYEMAITPRDVLARRIRMEITDWEATLKALPVVAELMGAELGWDQEAKEKQIDQYSRQLKYFVAEATFVAEKQ